MMPRDTPKTYTVAAAVGAVWGAVLILTHRLGVSDAVYCLLTSATLALIGDIDRRRHIIPNRALVLLFTIRGGYLITKAVGGEPFKTAAADSFIGFIAVALLCGVSFGIFGVLGHGDAVGMGDYKYLTVLGWCVGGERIVAVLLTAFAAAAVYFALRRIFFKEKAIARRALAPFLSFGAMLWLL